MTMLAYYLLGVVLGAGSSVIPGPCGLAIIDAATRLGTRRAVATAIGSGLGDLTYATIGVLGVGRLVAGDRALVAILLAMSGIVLIAYGIACVCSRPVTPQTPVRPLGGLVVGFATLICNPGALVTWSAVVGAQLAGATPAQQLCAVLGIGSGSLAWFAGMAYVSARGSAVLGARMHGVAQVAGSLIVLYGAISVARALAE